MHIVMDRRCSCGFEWNKTDLSEVCPVCHRHRGSHAYAEGIDIVNAQNRIDALERRVCDLEKRLAQVEPVGTSLAARLRLMDIVTGHR